MKIDRILGFRLCALSAGFTFLCIWSFAANAEYLSSSDARTVSNKAELSRALSCQHEMSVDDFRTLLLENRAHAIITDRNGNADYGLAEPVLLAGIPIQFISIDKVNDGAGGYVEFSARPISSTFSEVAQALNIHRNEDGFFYKTVGGNDLVVREESGHQVVACAYGVRTFKKKIISTFW